MSQHLAMSLLQSYLFIDIETIPQNREFLQMNEKWQALFIEKNAKFIDEDINVDNLYCDRAGIMAEFGKIICISLGYFFVKDTELFLKVKNISGHEETDVLQAFITDVEKFQQRHAGFNFVGHNIKEFDIPYICRRILANSLPYPAFLPIHNERPWESRNIDTLHWWRFGDYKSYITLNLLANVLNVPTSKTDIKGCDVRNVYYEQNNLKRIADYCGRDVAVVANLLLRFNNLPLLKETNIV